MSVPRKVLLQVLLRVRISIDEFLANPSHRLLDDSAAGVVAKACHEANKEAVWIEGFSNAGKSCLAKRAGRHLGWRVVHLDTLASDKAECDSYPAAMDTTKLREALGTPDLRSHVVIEGICLRDVVGQFINRRSAFAVYIMRVGRLGSPNGDLIWYDADDFNDLDARFDWTDRCAHEYHGRLRPQDDADLTFARIE